MKNAVKKLKDTCEDKLFNFRPVFFAAIFLCLGIVFSYIRIFYGVSPWWSLLLLPILATPFFFCRTVKRRYTTLLAVILLLGCFTTGKILFDLKISEYPNCGFYEKEETTVVGRVVEIEKKETYIKVVLDELSIGKNKENGKLVAYLSPSFLKNCQYSDRLLLLGKVETQTDFFDDYGFKAEALRENIRFRAHSVTSCTKVGHTVDVFAQIRQRMVDCLYAGMDETSASITVALLLGDTSGIEAGLLENVRYGGIAHIFAVSGLHVGALYAFLLVLLQKAKLKNLHKGLRFFALAFILFIYAGICNFSASVVRATVICLISYAGLLIGAKVDFLQSLSFSAIVILLFSPTSLFELGFQLSFVACLGLGLLSRPISEWLYKIFRPWIKEIEPDVPLSVSQRFWRAGISYVSACLAAQIATAPIQLYAFGYLSVWSLLLNMLFVPMISVSFAFLLATVVIA